MKRKIKRISRRKNRKHATRRKIISREKAPTTARQYFSKSRQFQETWDSIAHVISKMRSGRVSLRKATREFGVAPGQVIRLGRSALRKQTNGRYAATRTDRLLRVLGVLSVYGKRELPFRDSRQASVVGSHWDAVQRYLQTGDDSALRKFHGKKVTDANGKRHLLLTDTAEIDRLGSAGVLSFESLYAQSA